MTNFKRKQCGIAGCNNTTMAGKYWICPECYYKYRNEDGSLPMWLKALIKMIQSEAGLDKRILSHETPFLENQPSKQRD